MKKSIALSIINKEKFKTSKISYIFHKKIVFSITCYKCGLKNEKVFKE